MCRKHRRCRTNKAAAAARARRYRARRREAATTAAAEPTVPASNDQETAAVNPEQPAGGDVTPNQPDANQPRKSAFARRIEKFAKQEREAQARKQETNAHLAEVEKAAAAARQQNLARDQKAWEQRQAQAARKPTRAQGDVTRSKPRREVEDHTSDHTDTGTEHEREWKVNLGPAPTEGERARLEAFMKKMQAWAAASPDDRYTAGAKRDAATRAEIQARQARAYRPRREVEDHADGHASEQDRVWTVEPSPVPTAKSRTRGRDATQDTRRDTDKSVSRDGGVGPVSGEGNLTLVSPNGPLHISTSGPGGRPEVVGDVTPASGGEPTTSATHRKPEQPRRRTARQGDVTHRQNTGQDRAHSRAAHGRDTGDTGTVNVVGDDHITVTGARPGQVTRVTNYAAPGSHVGHQTTGHVHGITVSAATADRGTGGEDSQRGRDIARHVADRVHRAVADVADAIGDVTHNDPGDHTNSTSGTQAIQAPHIHNSRVVRDHD